MAQMILLFSHELTSEQEMEARERFHCTDFVYLPEELQRIWSGVTACSEDISSTADMFIEWLADVTVPGDFCLVQGDFGMTFMLVDWALKHGREPVYSSTERVFETHTAGDGTIVNTHRFRHVRFRHYRKYGLKE